jgi:hypothetical protein
MIEKLKKMEEGIEKMTIKCCLCCSQENSTAAEKIKGYEAKITDL